MFFFKQNFKKKKGNGNPYLCLNHVFLKGLNFRNYLKVNKIGSQKEYYS